MTHVKLKEIAHLALNNNYSLILITVNRITMCVKVIITNCHDVAEILLKVALNTKINQSIKLMQYKYSGVYSNVVIHVYINKKNMRNLLLF